MNPARPAARLRQIFERLSPTAPHVINANERAELLKEARALCRTDPRLEDLCARALGTQWAREPKQ